MGFGLGWRLAMPGDARPDDVRERLDSLRRYSLDLPFQKVFAVERLRGEGLEAERRRGRTRWVHGDLALPRAPGGECASIEAVDILSLVVWPGTGCETAWLGLARYPEADERAREVTAGKWYGRDGCKTLYAAHPNAGGLQHFMKCHVGLVAVLDEARRIGFEVDVRDDGDYGQRRDIATVIQKLHDAERVVAEIVGRLTDLMADRGEGLILAPMKGRADFERVEAGGAPPPPPPWDEATINLLRRTGGRGIPPP